MEEGAEEVLGLAQRLALHRTQALHSLHQGREFLLEGERRQLERKCLNLSRGNVGYCRLGRPAVMGKAGAQSYAQFALLCGFCLGRTEVRGAVQRAQNSALPCSEGRGLGLWGALAPREYIFCPLRGERVPEGRGGVRGHFLTLSPSQTWTATSILTRRRGPDEGRGRRRAIAALRLTPPTLSNFNSVCPKPQSFTLRQPATK